jgi:ectoine hydroxylase-related dioxygenase (phytanoyl-CoA dioxygenase family)
MNANEFLETYQREGIVVFDNLFSDATIRSWNERIDELFAKRESEERSYVKVSDLRRTGILDEMLCPEVRSMIRILEPSPELYHCHCYEIAGNQQVSHIMGHTLDGWHRDADVPPGPSASGAFAFSIFIYLTDVATKKHGAFEFIPRSREGDLENGHPTMVMTGSPGRTFFWNRQHFHRANPNHADIRRRVLKLSVQPAGTPNTYLETEEPRTVADAVIDSDPMIAHLLGAASRGANLDLGEAATDVSLPTPTVVPEADAVRLGWDVWRRKFFSRARTLLSRFTP